MPPLDQLLVYVIVAAAAAYLTLRTFRKKPGSCGGCDGCPSDTPAAESRSELIQLELPPKQ